MLLSRNSLSLRTIKTVDDGNARRVEPPRRATNDGFSIDATACLIMEQSMYHFTAVRSLQVKHV